MMTCDDVQDLLPELLPWISGPALAVHEHVQRCPECAELKDDLAHTLHALSSSPGAPTLSESFADRVVNALPDDAGWSVAQPRGKVIPLFSRAAASRRGRALLQTAAAAACFVAGVGAAFQLRGDGRIEGPLVAETPRHGWTQTAPAQNRRPTRTQGAPAVVQVGGSAHANGQSVSTQTTVAQTMAVDGQPATQRWIHVEDARPLASYMSQAGLVLQAVADLDERADPRALQVLCGTLQRSDLLDEGDELLQILQVRVEDGGGQVVELRRLIAGTQLVLRKVRNARRDASPEVMWALRREVRDTGLLDAYRQLLEAEARPETPRPSGRDPNEPL